MKKETVEIVQATLEARRPFIQPIYEDARIEALAQRIGHKSLEQLAAEKEDAVLNMKMLRGFVDGLPVNLTLSGIEANDEWNAVLATNNVVWCSIGEISIHSHIILGQAKPKKRHTPLLLQNYAFTKTAEVKSKELEKLYSRRLTEGVSDDELRSMLMETNQGRSKLLVKKDSSMSFNPQTKNQMLHLNSVSDEVIFRYRALEHMTELAIAFGVTEMFSELLEERKVAVG